MDRKLILRFAQDDKLRLEEFMQKLLLFIFTLFFLNFNSCALPKVNENILSYKIYGTTGHELQNQMNTVGPKNRTHQFNASTQWFVTWNYGYQSTKNSCHLTSLEVNLHIFYLLPIWMNYKNSHAGLQKRWGLCFKQLRNHEAGHGENGKKAAIVIEKALLKVSPQSSCDQLKTKIDTIANQIINDYLSKDLEYDKFTQHGRV